MAPVFFPTHFFPLPPTLQSGVIFYPTHPTQKPHPPLPPHIPTLALKKPTQEFLASKKLYFNKFSFIS